MARVDDEDDRPTPHQRCEANLALCHHEIRNLCARIQTQLATIRQLQDRIRELELKLGQEG